MGRTVNISTPPLPQTRNAHSSPWLESQGTPGRFVEVGNVPKVAEFFMRQQMKKDQPQHAARLKSLIASRA